MRLGGLISFVFCILAMWAKAQCTIIASVNSGCIPLPVKYTFSTTNSSPIATYHWDFGDADSSSQANPTHIYKANGKFYGKVTVTFANGTKCTVTLLKPVTIFSSPNADLNLTNNQQIILCTSTTPICFKDNSTPGTDKAPIVSWLWSFGDGSSATKQNPCYTYSTSGTYTVTLEVVDSNGCKNFIQKQIKVVFLTGSAATLNPTFTFAVSTNCQNVSRTVTFTNTTDTNGISIAKFIWNFGDGTGDTCTLQNPACLSQWLHQAHTYAANGTYFPSLYIENRQGCSASVNYAVVINASTFKMTILVSPTKTCFANNAEISFSTLSSNAMWDFGDPYLRTPGIFTAMKHKYSRPGIYTIDFKTNYNGCIYDSLMCKKVALLGPVALIMPTKGMYQNWNIAPPYGDYLIPPSTYKTYFDTECPGSAIYYTYTPVVKANYDTIFSPCQLDAINKLLSTDSLYACNHTKYPDTISVYKKHAAGFKDSVLQIATRHVWISGNPRPTGTLYSAPQYTGNPFYMDDTSLLSVRCKAPFKVKFTNYSIKYRGYDAIDNFPLAYPDTCLHPTYPYASDSLVYFWNFREGNNATSTRANPNIRDQYSNEKIPTHLFENDGCYMVIMQVTDPLTSCTDYDSLPVVLQQPDAGWAPEYGNIKNMTQLKQDSLPANGPRRGLILQGNPCLLNILRININETLPSCFKQSYAIVLDSARQVSLCGTTARKQFSWESKLAIQSNNYEVTYSDTGWKTLGFVVSNNANCSDTVWYIIIFIFIPSLLLFQFRQAIFVPVTPLKFLPGLKTSRGSIISR